MAADNIVDVTIQNFQQVLLEGSKEKLVIIDFWADWCEPCKQLMPTLERIASQYPEQVTLAKINCDDQQELAMQFGVRSLPTHAFFKDGQPVDSFAGVKSETEIMTMLSPIYQAQPMSISNRRNRRWRKVTPPMLTPSQASFRY